ncbi:MAG: hypothetical protein ACKVQU_28730 [Burkholderiales bacterium]
MHRIASLLPLLIATAVNAQTTTADTSGENAGPLTMILFAAVFFGACAWYAWMTWRNEKRDRQAVKKAG